ncbi:MAG: cupin domain-containing protein [Alphaproteobacteria bacterium]|jgi:gentisate 1,2-dioxygenase|nr:cupin domain-containing protein [Alphaproteobacteria bacterium]
MSTAVTEAAPDPADNIYSLRARYHSADNNFEFAWPPVPARQFLAERDAAFDPSAPTGLIALDAADALGTAYPATTPTLLLRYARLRAGEALSTRLRAGGEIAYVMAGQGQSRNGADAIAWRAGDLFCFPGGAETTHRAGAEDSLLLVASNEPLLALERLSPPLPGDSVVEAVHWPAAEIARRFEAIWQRPITEHTTGHAVLFSSPALAPSTNTLPSINVAINSLEAGRDQRPHRHNGVALTLAIQGRGVHSMIEGQRVDWSDGAVKVTPPAALHSHHNRGTERMLSLVIQDEALHYYTRTPGFSFD